MEAKFTPGPWFTSRPHGTIYIEARMRGTTLQEVAAVGPTETANQQEANARLIAAAPELLEALVLARKMCGLKGEVHRVIDAAISKATGEQA